MPSSSRAGAPSDHRLVNVPRVTSRSGWPDATDTPKFDRDINAVATVDELHNTNDTLARAEPQTRVHVKYSVCLGWRQSIQGLPSIVSRD